MAIFNINFDQFNMNMNDMNELVLIEIQLGNQIIERNQMPFVFARQHFMQIVKQIANEKRPMIARVIRQGENGKNDMLEFKNNFFGDDS